MDRAQDLSEDKIMARHRSFSFEFKRQVVLDFLEGREGMRELARKHSLSRNLLRLWVAGSTRLGELTDEVVDAVLASRSTRARSPSWNARSVN